ncbi:MAG: hypothetical protein H6739_14965 [Alphaproteobacteria bacterium]|nr:hypothetical protein [Alphaproteobacteria bacterium]
MVPLLALLACTAGAPAPPETFAYDLTHAGATVHVPVGAELSITLPAPDDTYLRAGPDVRGEGLFYLGVNPPEGGQQVYRFRVDAVGTFRVSFERVYGVETYSPPDALEDPATRPVPRRVEDYALVIEGGG